MKQVNNQSKIFVILAIVAVFIFAAVFLVARKKQLLQDNVSQTINSTRQPAIGDQSYGVGNDASVNSNQQAQKMQTINPVDGAPSRITKKPFGIYITPKTSPVQPERFLGYHTGTDLETTPEEQNIDVPVKSLCDGKLLVARYASGYGGVAVESCTLDGQVVTVVYGHINLESVAPKVGAEMRVGDFLANLGQGYSSQTDGERKHLHLGIHKGNGVNILGYVQSQSQLSGWIDAAKFLQ